MIIGFATAMAGCATMPRHSDLDTQPIGAPPPPPPLDTQPVDAPPPPPPTGH
ncbi:hypothetical protein [Asticcacaulis sp. MM231]|uniref:hypothetical protein n=1 Tax=Asticcacaulis sp. MM231 TaxID=3157666 RepID=UPI0032D586DA